MKRHHQPRPTVTRLALAVGALAMLSLLACGKSELGNQFNEGRAGLESAAGEALAELHTVRAKTIADRWEARDGMGAKGHPLRRWRTASVQDGLVERAASLVEANERSTRVTDFRSASQFLKEQAEYWADPKGKLNAYMKFLKQFIERAKSPADPFVQHARFEREFVHADHLFRVLDLPEERRITSFYRFWKFAFDFMPERREAFVFYVNRLCMQKLRDYCKPLMWEHRPYALKKPYMDVLLANLATFQKDYPDTPFAPVIRQIVMVYEEELKNVPSFEEYPVLPDGLTNKDAVGGNELVFGPRGVVWNGELLLELPGERLALESGERTELMTAFNGKLDKIIKAEAEVVADPAIDRVVVQADGTAPLNELAPLFGALQDHQLIVMGLMSRRRTDLSNRKVGTYLAVFYAPPPLDEELEKRKTPEQKETEAKERLEHDPRRRVPEAIAGMTCRALGRTREFEATTKQATTYVAYGPEEIAYGRITAPESYAEATATAGKPEKKLATADALGDPSVLAPWTDAPGDAIVLAFHQDLTWQQLVTFLHLAHIQCKGEGCAEPEERTHQIHIALCE